METAEIQMSPRAARTEAERYSRCRDLTKTDRLIMKAYKSIAHGSRIIDLKKTMEIAGFDDNGRPRLAICCANATRVDVRCWPGSTEFKWNHRYYDRSSMRIVGFGNNRTSTVDGWATTPYIPPYIRRARMSRYFVLWEATWHNVPAGDPYLLEQIDQNLFRVVAAWDITPLEAAVLRR